MRRSAEGRVPGSRLGKESHTLVTPVLPEPAHPRTWLGGTWWGQSPAWLARSGREATGPFGALAGGRPSALALGEDRFDRLQELADVERFFDERCDTRQLHPLPGLGLDARADHHHRDGGERVEFA